MTLCRNSTNKIFLQRTLYPGDSEESWYIGQAGINAALLAGQIPEVVLPDCAEDGRPRIAVVLNRNRHPGRVLRDYSMPQRYVDAVCLSGGYPVFVCFENVAEQLEKINPDGILLTGGDFAFPAEWNEDAPAHAEDMQRFEAYLACVEFARRRRLPVLGICAGMQVLGGIGGAKVRKVAGHRGRLNELAHDMIIEPDSLLASIAGKRKVRVNSNHSEALSSEVPGCCRITAFAPDGVIEAVELPDAWHPFVLGIQSHPERFVKSGDEFAVRLFGSFIKACRK